MSRRRSPQPRSGRLQRPSSRSSSASRRRSVFLSRPPGLPCRNDSNPATMVGQGGLTCQSSPSPRRPRTAQDPALDQGLDHLEPHPCGVPIPQKRRCPGCPSAGRTVRHRAPGDPGRCSWGVQGQVREVSAPDRTRPGVNHVGRRYPVGLGMCKKRIVCWNHRAGWVRIRARAPGEAVRTGGRVSDGIVNTNPGQPCVLAWSVRSSPRRPFWPPGRPAPGPTSSSTTPRRGPRPTRRGSLFDQPARRRSATEVASGGVAVLDSTAKAAESAGYFSTGNPLVGTLDRASGFTARVRLQLQSESHAPPTTGPACRPDRPGERREGRGARLLGRTRSRAQNDFAHVHPRRESAAFNATGPPWTTLRVDPVQGTGYSLSAGGVYDPFCGSVHDY